MGRRLCWSRLEELVLGAYLRAAGYNAAGKGVMCLKLTNGVNCRFGRGQSCHLVLAQDEKIAAAIPSMAPKFCSTMKSPDINGIFHMFRPNISACFW